MIVTSLDSGFVVSCNILNKECCVTILTNQRSELHKTQFEKERKIYNDETSEHTILAIQEAAKVKIIYLAHILI